MAKKKRDKKKDDLFEEKVEKEEVEETEEEETEDEEEENEEREETVKLDDEELAKVKELAEGSKFGVQKLSKTVFAVVNKRMEIVRSYKQEEGCDDPEACAISYCEKLIKKSL